MSGALASEPDRSFTHLASGGWARLRCKPIPAAARVFVFASLLCLGGAPGWAQQKDQQPQQKDKQQMRGLDEQIQEIKSDVLGISQELSQLEEKLLYPSGTQVAIFIAM